MQLEAEKQYSVYLKHVQNILRNKITDSSTLHKLGKYLFASLFQGVFARDTLPAKVKYAIGNLDRSDQEGSHWVAIADGMIYDSFGRDVGLNRQMTAKDAEQGVQEENCGQRCKAFLCVYHVLGPKYAMHI